MMNKMPQRFHKAFLVPIFMLNSLITATTYAPRQTVNEILTVTIHSPSKVRKFMFVLKSVAARKANETQNLASIGGLSSYSRID